MTTFPASVYADRLVRLRELATAARTPAVITPGADLAYLTGMRSESFERLTALVVAEHAISLVVPRLEGGIVTASPVPEITVNGTPITVVDWEDGGDPYAMVIDQVGTATAIVIADAAPALHVVPLAERGLTVGLATELLRTLRMYKDPAEIAELRAAGAAIDRVHARVPEFLRVGRTEREVARDIADAIVAEGHRSAAFVIVGSGPNGADPHHEVSDRTIMTGDVVVVDIGGPLASGYHSDCTRTYSMGAPAPEVAQRFAVLARAHAASVAAVRPGVAAADIDAAGRQVLIDAGFGENFIHRTGHGIGLSVHEEPYIVAGNQLSVRPGMAFSIEPGIYFNGAWGARIEDIVIVTEDACESVNRQSRHLTVV